MYKTITEDNINFFKLGQDDGYRQAQVAMDKLKLINSHMLEIITDLDEHEPRIGVTITFTKADAMSKSLIESGNKRMGLQLREMAEKAKKTHNGKLLESLDID